VYCGRQEEPAILISTLLLQMHEWQLCTCGLALTLVLLDSSSTTNLGVTKTKTLENEDLRPIRPGFLFYVSLNLCTAKAKTGVKQTGIFLFSWQFLNLLISCSLLFTFGVFVLLINSIFLC